jgi:hypothetical protein
MPRIIRPRLFRPAKYIPADYATAAAIVTIQNSRTEMLISLVG